MKIQVLVSRKMKKV